LISIGERISALRRRAGLTQSELAERAALSVGGLRDLEQHRVARPRAGTLRRLGVALELSCDETADLLRQAQESATALDAVQIQVLGPLTVWVDGEALQLRSEPQRRVLAVLALSPNVPIGIEAMVDLVWGRRPPVTASDLVRSQLSRLRRKLQTRLGRSEAGNILVATAAGYALSVEPQQVDHLRFQLAVEQARRDRATGRVEAALVEYQRALELWRGSPLEDLPELHARPAVHALVREHERMVLEYADVAAELGRHEAALPALHDLAVAAPLHEPAHAKLMVALAATGQQVAALQIYQDLRCRLSDELGLDPVAELQQVHHRILTGSVDGSVTVPEPVRVGSVTGVPIRPAVGAPMQLAAEPQGFVGRADQLATLDAMLDGTHDDAGVVGIAAICGTAGAGKTALALHWAHRAAPHFPDGQLYVDLRGFGPDPAPADPAAVLAGFIEAMGVPAERIPADRTHRAATFRSLLAGKRVLVVLDNAQDADQVRPMLPGTPGCMVLVTSRSPMRGLVAREAARAMPLDLLSRNESHELLARRLGAQRLADEPDAVEALIDRCARLPLALAIAAALAATNPGLRLSALAAELHTEGALHALCAGEPATDLRRVFSWSYAKLGQHAALLFRMLGRHPEPEVDLRTAMALVGDPSDRTQHAMAELARAHLVMQRAPQRYAVHSLLQAYAADLAA
jgi:DNA-binding SARP family transcriptional activator